MKNRRKLLTLAIVVTASGGAFAQSQQKAPYWASLDEAQARMRTGPSTEFPVKWVYRRQNLPVKVVAVHSVWRKVEDQDGDQGWMHVRLLSPARTAVVIGTGIGAMRETPDGNARINWRVEPGVVGRIEECENGWCRFENDGRFGFIEAARLWGDDAP